MYYSLNLICFYVYMYMYVLRHWNYWYREEEQSILSETFLRTKAGFSLCMSNIPVDLHLVLEAILAIPLINDKLIYKQPQTKYQLFKHGTSEPRHTPKPKTLDSF